MVDNKTKNKIISALRKLTFAYTPRNEAKKSRKVDKATFRCEKCGVLVYEGKSKKNYKSLCDKWKEEILMDKIYMDHIVPIIDPDVGWEGWDKYINRMFCKKEGFQSLCFLCHTLKSKKENKKRKK